MPPAERAERIGRRWLLAAILILAALRPLILFKSPVHVNFDESIIGLMAKHIREGRSRPFYMYGQNYNAGAAWEAYLAAAPFAVFGAEPVALKSVAVILSLFTLLAFYMMARRLHGRTAALLAALVFALAPPLSKWNFQVRGYSFYFLSIPLLTILFLDIESSPAAEATRTFLLGLASGLSLLSLELGLPPIAAFWLLLIARRKLSARTAAAGAAGFLLGYGPAIAFNVAHRCANWRAVFVNVSPGGAGRILADPSTYAKVFLHEMPNFFGSDTVFWYYPRTSAAGVALYIIALAAVALAVRRAWKAPISQKNDFFMLTLAAACFVPYLATPYRVPGYFLGGYFFLAVLIGRLLERCLLAPSAAARLMGGALLLACVWTGVRPLIDAASRNEVEILAQSRAEDSTFKIFPPQAPARVPGVDIEAVQRHLRRGDISSVWTEMPFVYPLLFESGETLSVTDPILGSERWIYPENVPLPRPKASPNRAFVIETASPYRADAEAKMEKLIGGPPLVARYGTLTVIEARRRAPRSR